MSARKLIAFIAAILFVVLMVIANLGGGSEQPTSPGKSPQPIPDYNRPPEEKIPTH